MGSDWKKISWQMTTERVGTSAGCFLVYERITKTGYMNHKSKTEIGEDIDEECTIQPDGCGEEEIKEIAQYCHTNKAVCLNSATACLASILRLQGIGPGDEVITSAYTFTASASSVCYVGEKLVLVDVQKDSYEMDYELLGNAVIERAKAIILVDLGGVVCDCEKLYKITNRQKNKFHPNGPIQEAFGRGAVVTDAAYVFGARRKMDGDWKMCGEIADFTSFSFHAVNVFETES